MDFKELQTVLERISADKTTSKNILIEKDQSVIFTDALAVITKEFWQKI